MDEPLSFMPGETLRGTYRLFYSGGIEAGRLETIPLESFLNRGPVTIVWSYKSPDDNFACASGVATLR